MNKIELESKTTENTDWFSGQIFASMQKKLGRIPGRYTQMANNPAMFHAYICAFKSFQTNSGFNQQEQKVVLLSISYENSSDYSLAAFNIIRENMVPDYSEEKRLKNENSVVENKKLQALSSFSKIMTIKMGKPSNLDIKTFLDAGYSKKHILGVIAGLGIDTMSNYFNNIFTTPIDDAFQHKIWEKNEIALLNIVMN